jgi:hypothetical protein
MFVCGRTISGALALVMVPVNAERVDLVGSKRVIHEEHEGDHAISNAHVGLMRLCSSGAPSATDYRFLHILSLAVTAHILSFAGHASKSVSIGGDNISLQRERIRSSWCNALSEAHMRRTTSH